MLHTSDRQQTQAFRRGSLAAAPSCQISHHASPYSIGCKKDAVVHELSDRAPLIYARCPELALAVIGITKVRSINHCINNTPSRTSWQRGERVHGETMDPRHPGKHVPCVLAHDVLNKVAGIIGFCELLESDQSESEKELHMRRLRATALLLAELIQERSCDLAVICLSGEAADTGRSTERKPQESISEREHPRTSVSPV